MDASLEWCSTPPLWHTKAVGGRPPHQSLAPRIAEIEADIAALMAFRDKPSGTIKITLSDHALESVVWPKLRPLLVDYPTSRSSSARTMGCATSSRTDSTPASGL